MKRITAVIGLVLVIGAMTAAAAQACVVAGFKVKAPPPHSNANEPTTFRACIPNTQGTNNARFNSPAITNIACAP
jgi:hypothetical protein